MCGPRALQLDSPAGAEGGADGGGADVAERVAGEPEPLEVGAPSQLRHRRRRQPAARHVQRHALSRGERPSASVAQPTQPSRSRRHSASNLQPPVEYERDPPQRDGAPDGFLKHGPVEVGGAPGAPGRRRSGGLAPGGGSRGPRAGRCPRGRGAPGGAPLRATSAAARTAPTARSPTGRAPAGPGRAVSRQATGRSATTCQSDRSTAREGGREARVPPRRAGRAGRPVAPGGRPPAPRARRPRPRSPRAPDPVGRPDTHTCQS